MASSTNGRSSIGNSGSVSSVIRRRPLHCACEEVVVSRTVNDITSVNYGKRFGHVEIGDEILMQVVGSLSGLMMMLLMNVI
jgi:hypothetical protein